MPMAAGGRDNDRRAPHCEQERIAMSYDRKLDDEGIPPLDDPEALEWMMNA